MTDRKTGVAELPTGPLRWMLRLPIVLYRLRLGWLLGGRFVLLRHVGRKTGQERQTVVEVIGHDTTTDTYFVASGWGYKANWYQNICQTPRILIQVGRRKLTVDAETLTPAAGAQILIAYRQQYPRAASELSRFMGLNMLHASPEELEQIIQESLPIIAFRPA